MNDNRPKNHLTWCRRALRVSLQLRIVLILALLVIVIAAAGGSLYFGASREWLIQSDRQHAMGLASMLASGLRLKAVQQDRAELQRLLIACVEQEHIPYAAVLDLDGNVLIEASSGHDQAISTELKSLPVSLTSIDAQGQDTLAVAQPILITDDGERRLAGALRLVIDTSKSAERLAMVQQQVIFIASVVVLLAVPVGYLLVWRVLVQRLKRLVAVTRQLGRGDFAARARMKKNDEIGELACSFDTMAGEVARMQDELVQANQQLENKVIARTTELELSNRRIREEMSEKEDFLRAVSHDLNAPLRNIAGMATMLTTKWGDQLPEEVVERLQRIQTNVDAGESLIGELLELSRVRTRPEVRQLVDMRELIEQVGQTLEYELKARDIQLKIGLEMPRLYVGPNRLRQVFQNLIDNAVKYMHRDSGGRIEVSYRFSDDQHVFSVSDNGRGIAPDKQEQIFYVFRRIQDAATAEVDGKGVGLALVKAVVANYDGRAWVESQVGRGSTFYVSLSVDATQPPEQGADEPREEYNVEAVSHIAG